MYSWIIVTLQEIDFSDQFSGHGAMRSGMTEVGYVGHAHDIAISDMHFDYLAYVGFMSCP